MPRTEPPNGAEQPEVPTPNGPQRGVSTVEERAQRTVAAALSWQAVKERFEPRVEQEGFDVLPEPDSPEFPSFLADLNAVNPSLARELVHETRRLRRELDMPSPRASRRRERNRATRRLLFMRQTPDGRWVFDKEKAPIYGMTALLAVGGLLTAVYALPRLAGKPAIAARAATPPTGATESAEVTPPEGEAESEAALKKSREDLARFRREQAAREAAERAAQPKPTAASGGTDSSSTNRIKPLVGSEPNPPAPPAIPSRPVQTPTTAAPAVFAPVPQSSPAPQAIYTPPPAPAPTPVEVTPPVTYTPEPAPSPVRVTPPVAHTPPPAPSRAAPTPARSTAATTPPRSTAANAAARTPAVTPPQTADVSASFGALPVMPSPVDAPPVVASSQDTSPAPASSAAFGNVPESATIPGAEAAASGPGFTSGLVYERASQ